MNINVKLKIVITLTRDLLLIHFLQPKLISLFFFNNVPSPLGFVDLELPYNVLYDGSEKGKKKRSFSATFGHRRSRCFANGNAMNLLLKSTLLFILSSLIVTNCLCFPAWREMHFRPTPKRHPITTQRDNPKVLLSSHPIQIDEPNRARTPPPPFQKPLEKVPRQWCMS